jgi:hypothetical protein
MLTPMLVPASARSKIIRCRGKLRQIVLGERAAAVGTVEEKLDAKTFFRANRQQIVNLEFVQSV